MKNIFILIILMTFLGVGNSQIGRLSLSPRQTVNQTIGKTEITVDYSRPSMRGRVIFGNLVPYNNWWRTGANRNTTIELSKKFMLGDSILNGGKYAIFTMPKKDEWEVILYEDTNNWNVPSDLDEEKIAARITVASRELNLVRENLTISIGNFNNYNFMLDIEWEKTQVSIPFGLSTADEMDGIISDVLNGPDYEDYYAAAEYQMESGHDYLKGLQWIKKGMEIADKVTWWDYRLKSNLYLGIGNLDAAQENAEIGLKMAKEVKRQYGIDEFNKLFDLINKRR